MSAVYPQLMSPSRVWPQGEEGMRAAVKYTVLGDGSFAVLGVDRLQRPVHGVAAQGQVDDAVLTPRRSLYKGEVFLLDRTGRELILQVMVGLCSLCHDE